jgi:hypothetical protein
MSVPLVISKFVPGQIEAKSEILATGYSPGNEKREYVKGVIDEISPVEIAFT